MESPRQIAYKTRESDKQTTIWQTSCGHREFTKAKKTLATHDWRAEKVTSSEMDRWATALTRGSWDAA